jgi:2-keto-4-pentenoate hydratase/2-oxohepta-3-ene-1,7-dioic acid hydratase in catechol pathway
MRWLRFTKDQHTSYGLMHDESRVQKVMGDPFNGYQPEPLFYDLADLKIELPLQPKTFYCAGMNYSSHIKAVAQRTGVTPELPKQADIGYRANNALIATREEVVMPADAQSIQYEGELVVVIGRKAKHLSPAEALGCVLGYTIGNDVSERVWQKSDRTFWRSKNTDTFKPMGPWIETDFDLSRAKTRIHVNGVLTTEFDTGAMIFDIPTFISKMTQYLTLWPGDMIWMGTDGSSPNLKHNDQVDIEITGLGVLQNRFVMGA